MTLKHNIPFYGNPLNTTEIHENCCILTSSIVLSFKELEKNDSRNHKYTIATFKNNYPESKVP